jgi:AcrR family transcriptional regulator
VAVEGGSDLPQRIMSAAKDLFFVKGFAKTSLRAIASQAGTSESGILRIYQSKNGLLRAVYASCYGEINDHVDTALAAAAERDSDPRSLLLELMRAVLEGYQADPPKSIFLLSHFGFRETMGLSVEDGVDPAVDAAVRREYSRYLGRIRDLSEGVFERWPVLAASGVTCVALQEVFTSIIYGIQTSWFMAEEDPVRSQPQVTIEEAEAAMRFFLYPETLAS